MIVFELPLILYSLVINILATFTSRIPLKIRSIMLNAAMFGLCLIGIVGYSNIHLKKAIHFNDWRIIVSTLLLLVILIASIDKKIAYKKDANIFFWSGWLICFAMMFFSSMKYPVHPFYFQWSILSLSIFPLLYITWQRKNNYSNLFFLMAINMVKASFVFFILSIVLGVFISNPEVFAEGDYTFLGIAGNNNSDGLICLPFFTAALYLLITEKRNSIIYLLSLSISVSITIISKTRTAELAMLLETIIALLTICFHYNCFKRIVDIKRIIIAIAIAFLISLAAGIVLIQVDKVDLNSYALTITELDETYTQVYSNEKLAAIDRASTGRLVLWLSYLKKVEFRGHGNPQGPLFEGYDYSEWAHNNALDIWYASGFLAFAGFLIWLLSALRYAVKCATPRREYRRECMLTSLAVVGYFVEAMLEITMYPTNTGIVLMAFLCIGPVAFLEKRVDRL